MNIKHNLRKITELGIGLTAVTILALAGCGGGGGGSNTPPSMMVSTFAGSGTYGVSNGAALTAQFRAPSYFANVGNYLYVTDTSANNIRRIDITTGDVTTFAGSTVGASGITDSPALFNQPMGITTDGNNLYVADFGNQTIRKIVINTQVVSTLAGIAGVIGSPNAASAIPGTSATFRYPMGIARIQNNLYVADSSNSTIRKIDISNASNVVTTLAGSPLAYGNTDNPTSGASTRFFLPFDLTTDGSNLFVTEYFNNDVRRVDPTSGATTLVAGGNYSLANSGVGSTDGIGSEARFYHPNGITTDGTNLYVTDSLNFTIRKIVIATGFVSTPAGAVNVPGATDGSGPNARFFYPIGIIYVGGALYVADQTNRIIRKIQL